MEDEADVHRGCSNAAVELGDQAARPARDRALESFLDGVVQPATTVELACRRANSDGHQRSASSNWGLGRHTRRCVTRRYRSMLSERTGAMDVPLQ
jgi:hypothetical protein